MIEKLKNRFLLLRKSLISSLLRMAQFNQIVGHWIYVPLLSKAKPIIFDLGANHGCFSSEMQKRFESANFLFEANDSLCKLIDTNVGEVFNFAVSSKCGIAEFIISENHEASSFNAGNFTKFNAQCKKEVQTVDWCRMLELTNNTTNVIDLVKIDIEGAEIEFLYHLTNEQLQRIKSITVEFHDWIDDSLHRPTIEVINRLRNYGFITFTDAPNHSWPVEMCFINKNFLRTTLRQKVLFRLYNLLKF